MTDTIFADGFRFDRPRDGAPEFIKGRLSVRAEQAIPFIQAHANERGYVNLDLKVSKEGKLYLQLDNWNPPAKAEDDLPPL